MNTIIAAAILAMAIIVGALIIGRYQMVAVSNGDQAGAVIVLDRLTGEKSYCYIDKCRPIQNVQSSN
jgi:hypothetical protein